MYRRATNLCLMRDCCMNTRFIATAARGVNRESSHKRSKTKKKKADFSNVHEKERKLLRERLLMASNGTSKSHVYKKLYPWEASEQLAEHLKTTEVYNNDGLIALNKPYGIAMDKPNKSETSEPQTVVETLNSGSVPAHVPAMSQVLPHLKKQYGVDHLEIIKSTERWSSGLMLLSTSDKLTERVQKCLRRSKALTQPAMTYWAVTVGLPNPVVGSTKVATKLEYVHNVGNVPVVIKKYSKTAAKIREVKQVVVQHKALMYNKEVDVSLLEIKAQVFQWHFLRVWLAHCYSPALGDHLYSGRVKTLLGRKIQVSPHNVSHEPQTLPDSLYSILSLPPRSSELIPCHMHLSEINLSQFNNDKSDLVISATPPEYFMWTCKQLGLLQGQEDSNGESNCVKIGS